MHVLSSAKANNRSQGAFLALIPLMVAIVLLALLLPHAAPPDDVPLPHADMRTLHARALEEESLLHTLDRSSGLTPDVRDLGTSLRALHEAQAKGYLKQEERRPELSALKARVEQARALAVATSGETAVRTLFALQKRNFLTETARLDTETDELRALAGDFVARMRAAGWLDNGRLVLSREQLGVVFKSMWAHDVGLELDPWFDLSLDEKRLLHSIYLAHPRLPESLREALVNAKSNAKDAATCLAVEREIDKARETWRAEKIESLASIDARYPREYALGISNYRQGKLPQAQALFRRWLELHPDGAYTVRAQNFLKAVADKQEGR
jgi:TolA-binding protein